MADAPKKYPSAPPMTDEERAANKVSRAHDPLGWQRSLGYAGWEVRPEQCCAAVHDGRVGFNRCSKKAKIHIGRLGYCATHDPAAVVKRAKANMDRMHASMAKDHKRWDAERLGRDAIAALRLIAAGHNDAVGLARETLAEFDAKYPPEPAPETETEGGFKL